MHVTGIHVIPVEVPVKTLDEEYGIAPYVAGGRLSDVPESVSFEEALAVNDSATTSGDKLLVRLETEGDVTGWGEMKVSNPGPSGTEMAGNVGQTILEQFVAPEAEGREVWEIERFREQFDTYPNAYYRDITPFVAAVEMAMWDAWGKHLGVPVHQLIGGKYRDTVPLAFCLGLLTPEESRNHAQFARDNGFSVLKTKASRYWRKDVERIVAMDEAVDGDLNFRIDPNQSWSFEDTVRFAAHLEDEGIYLQYLEQPVRIDTLGTLSKMRERLKTPIAVNEDTYRTHGLAAVVREDAADAAVVDVVPAGGILGLKELAAVGGEAGISLSHHSNFDLGIKMAAKLHVAASTPAFNLPLDSVYYAYEDYLLENPLKYTDGSLTVPDKPGLAGAIDEDKLERYRKD